jgi:hypothetical protein
MKEEVMRKWVAALRSGEYKQTKRNLRDEHGFCCLGVLCDLYAKETGEGTWALQCQAYEPDFYVFSRHDEWSRFTLPPERVAQGWAGMHTNNGSIHRWEKGPTLTDLNDSGKTFAKIADHIERNWERL